MSRAFLLMQPYHHWGARSTSSLRGASSLLRRSAGIPLVELGRRAIEVVEQKVGTISGKDGNQISSSRGPEVDAMPLLYYWRPDNYSRDRSFGFGYHLNQ